MTEKLYGICGPTASGKTEIALRVCEALGGEVVSADSMQVYTGMNILSAKPNADERKRVRHHLIDFVPPQEKYNASKYREDALEALDDIRRREAMPFLCGGTGLYIDALTKGIKMSEQADDAIRSRLKQIALEPGGKMKLHDLLALHDPDSAKKYDPNDTRRVIRSLEIFYQTGKPRGEQEKRDREAENTFDTRLFALKWDREALYRRIEQRVDAMIERGLVKEVQTLMNADAQVQETAGQAIGYKEIRRALEGEISLDEAIVLTKTKTRHLAKRQETWFRRDTRIQWLSTDGSNFDEIAEFIVNKIREETNEPEA